VQQLGVARVVYPPQYRAQRVAQELRWLLEQEEYGRAASAVAAKVRAEDGTSAACDAIEEQLLAGKLAVRSRRSEAMER